MNIHFLFRLVAAWLILLPLQVSAEYRHPYPEPPLDADTIARQVYLLTHGSHVKNAVTRARDGQSTLLINRTPGRRPSVNKWDSYINNGFDDGLTESRQIAIFRSGKLRGTGILMTSFLDHAREPNIVLWLPTLRKLRRMTAPRHEDYWSGSIFTYGEIFLRRPEHERHELLFQANLESCLGVLLLSPSEQDRRTQSLPEPACEHQGKPVYRLKSSTHFQDWWYDERITDIDTRSFAPYRTMYYKDQQLVKTIEADWQPLEHPDPRVVYPRYVYAHSLVSGQESLVYVPRETVAWDQDIPDNFWSEKTLRKIKR